MKNIQVNLVNATHRNCYTQHWYEVVSDQPLDENDRKELIAQNKFMIGQTTGQFNWQYETRHDKFYYTAYSACDSSD